MPSHRDIIFLWIGTVTGVWVMFAARLLDEARARRHGKVLFDKLVDLTPVPANELESFIRATEKAERQ